MSDRLPESDGREGDESGRVVQHRDLVSALAELPKGQRAVVVLRYFDDRTESETADLLGVSVGTVKSQASRALATLRSPLRYLGL